MHVPDIFYASPHLNPIPFFHIYTCRNQEQKHQDPSDPVPAISKNNKQRLCIPYREKKHRKQYSKMVFVQTPMECQKTLRTMPKVGTGKYLCASAHVSAAEW